MLRDGARPVWTWINCRHTVNVSTVLFEKMREKLATIQVFAPAPRVEEAAFARPLNARIAHLAAAARHAAVINPAGGRPQALASNVA